MKAVISNGGDKFHLAPLAVEIASAGKLAGFLAAGYPIGWQKWLAQRFPDSPGWQRFLGRAEQIPKELVQSIFVSDVFFKIGKLLFRHNSRRWEQRVAWMGFHVYSAKAGCILKKIKPDIYHYRNCYGLKSVEVAKKLGAITLCDHSIAHPLCLQWMDNHRGEWPTPAQFNSIRLEYMPLNRLMERDLNLADHTLVNSDFLKQTCIHSGMDGNRVHVIYWGVDEAFFQFIQLAELKSRAANDTILFAGEWQRRKGVDTLAEALKRLNSPWKLEICGNIDAEVHNLSGMNAFLSDSRVKLLGILPRKELAMTMKRHRIFVFPSYCEGSARVIFEAMAAGCYIITTTNSGSIVEDGIHGRLVPAGDPIALSMAIEEALADIPKAEEIGRRNAQVVAQHYRQKEYGRKVQELYGDLLEQRAGN